MYCRAPSVDRDARGPIRSVRLGPGRSAAPGEQRLTLLPSGPDVVHASPLRGTRSSTPLAPSASANAGLERGFSPAEAVCRFRAPLVPRLARPRDDTPRPAAGRRVRFGLLVLVLDEQAAGGVVRAAIRAAGGQRGAEHEGVAA